MKIGETLRQAREKAGLSIEDVRNTTQIMAQQLVAMEADDFSSFTAPVYAKGFLRLFARAVGLDPVPLVAEFDANLGVGGRAAMPSGAMAAPHEQTSVPEKPSAPSSAEPAVKATESAPPVPVGAPETPAAPDLFLFANGTPANGNQPNAGGQTAGDPVLSPPAPRRNAEAHPGPPAAPSATDAVPARRCEKKVVSTPFPFERKSPPKPLPEKRVALPEPGAPAHVPPVKVRESVVVPSSPATVPLSPISKPVSVPHAALSPDAKNLEHAQLPDPLPQNGAFFSFPEYTPAAAPFREEDDDSADGTPSALKVGEASPPKAVFSGAKAVFGKLCAGFSAAGRYSRRRTSSFFRQISLLRKFGGGKALAAVAALAVLLVAVGVFSSLARRDGAADDTFDDPDVVDLQDVPEVPPSPEPDRRNAVPSVRDDAGGESETPAATPAIDPRYAELVPILPPPASFAN